MPRPKLSPTPSTDAAQYWNVEGGLRSSELLLLQRALAFYGKEYQKQKGASDKQFEKDECDQYIAAADRLSDKLRHNLVKVIK